jgi:sortase A
VRAVTDDPAAGGASATDCWPELPAAPATSDPVAARAAPAAWQRVGRGPKRRTRWDRPAHPKDWRFYVGWVGRTLIVLGLLMFLFVAYQLWGTGIETARAQDRLEDEFAQLLEANQIDPVPATTVTTVAPVTTVATATSPTTAATAVAAPATTAAAPTTAPPAPTTAAVVPAEQQNLPSFENGDPVARLTIPRLDLDWTVVSGVTRNDLKEGPGHFRDTPLPGQLGNSAIAGHRTTSGAPFGSLDVLAPGDDVEVLLPNGYRYVYVVTGSEVVTPDDYRVISQSDEGTATLTLVTCTPKWSSTHRLIVYSELDPARSDPVGEPIITGPPEEPELDVPAATTPATEPAGAPGSAPTPTAAPTSDPATPAASVAPPTTSAAVAAEAGSARVAPAESDAFSEGWFADKAAWPQIILWGLALVAVATFGWWLARFWRREWVGALAAFVPFFVCLYFFFQNVNRLLPPGL